MTDAGCQIAEGGQGGGTAELAVWDGEEWEAVSALPEQWTPDEWAERRLVLPAADHAEPGPYRASRTPYVRGPLAAYADAVVEFLVLTTGTQVAKTMMLTIMAGYAVDQHPGPILLVEPTKTALDKLNVRLERMIVMSPGFADNLAGDKNAAKGYAKRFKRCTLYQAWSGSEAELAGTPIREVYLDETDKYPAPLVGQGWPSQHAIERTSNFPGRKVVRACTPSTNYGEIWVELKASLLHVFIVPCPHCLGYQLLVFRGSRGSESGVRWPAYRERGAAVAKAAGRELGEMYGVTWAEGERDWRKIHTQHLAWYECRWCGGRIETWQKPWMLARGVWVAGRFVEGEEDEGSVVLTENSLEFLEFFGGLLEAACGRGDADDVIGGRLSGAVAERLMDAGCQMPDARQEDGAAADAELERRRAAWRAEWGSHVGFWLPGLNSPFHARSWWSFAATFLRYKDTPERLKTFRQDWQGLPWTEDIRDATEEQWLQHVGATPRGLVPSEVQVLTAGVDVADYMYHTAVVGWGEAGKMWLLDESVYESPGNVKDRLLRGSYGRAAVQGEGLMVAMGFWDSGWQAGEQYEECREFPDRLRPIKGQPGTRMGGRLWSATKMDIHPLTHKAFPGGMLLVSVNVDAFKDTILLHRLLVPPGGPGYLELHAEPSEELLRHLVAEHKVIERDKSGHIKEHWAVVESRPNHYLDALVYAVAAGEYIGARTLGPVPSGDAGADAGERVGRREGGRRTAGWASKRRRRW